MFGPINRAYNAAMLDGMYELCPSQVLPNGTVVPEFKDPTTGAIVKAYPKFFINYGGSFTVCWKDENLHVSYTGDRPPSGWVGVSAVPRPEVPPEIMKSVLESFMTSVGNKISRIADQRVFGPYSA